MKNNKYFNKQNKISNLKQCSLTKIIYKNGKN